MTIPYTTGLPEDVVMNTFHFITANPQPTAGEIVALNTLLEAFYNTSSGVAGDALAGFMASLCSRVASVCTIDYFALSDPEPRLPVSSHPWTLAAADVSGYQPTEVALCLSMQADPVSGIPQARRRGRVYLGPFNNAVNDTTTGRPTTALINSCVAAGNALLDGASPAGTPLAVFSRVGNAGAAVDNGWVDNEWDTMRSRGRRATTRTAFQL